MRKRITMAQMGAVVALAAVGGMTSHAEDYLWTNAGGDNDYMNAGNWATNGVPAGEVPPATNTTSAAINLTGTDRCKVVDGQNIPNINELRIGYEADGEFEQTGGIVTATQNSARYSKMGWNGYAGLYTLSGGVASLNALYLGAGGGTGTMLINGGTLSIARSYNGSSLLLGLSSSTGTVEIASGGLTTRSGVTINSAGTFAVKGGGAVLIGIGNSSEDGFWTQTEGSTLKVQIDANGVTPIKINALDGTPGTGGDGIATFALGSELDVSFLGGYQATNAWTIMEADGGIVDNGLKFAAGVDSNKWEMILTSNKLWVTYGGASIEPPVLTTNLYANAVVTTPDTWNLFAPLSGSAALSNPSSSGFIVTIGPVTNWLDRPVVAQEFGVDADISKVGQAVKVSFDVELLDAVTIANDADFRFSFYDTNQNCQIIAGMIDFGPPGGNTMKIRVEEKVSLSDTNNLTFVPGDYAGLGNGSTTLGQVSGSPGSGLQKKGEVFHMESTVTRTATNEVGVATSWSDIAGVKTVTCIAPINETVPLDPEGMPFSGRYGALNGFGFKLFDDAPFGALASGSFKVSNYKVSYTAALPNGFSYNISGITLAPSGDVILTLSEPVVGATYKALGSPDLLYGAFTEIGSYVAEAPGIITIPAVDAAPYINTPNGFFDVELPVMAIEE